MSKVVKFDNKNAVTHSAHKCFSVLSFACNKYQSVGILDASIDILADNIYIG